MASSCGQCSTQQDGSQEPNQQTSNSKTQTSKAPAAGAALERGCTGACFFRGLVVPGLLLLRPAYSGVGGRGGGEGGFFCRGGGGGPPPAGARRAPPPPPAPPPGQEPRRFDLAAPLSVAAPARWSTRRRPRTTALRSGGAFVRRRPG